MKLQLDPVHVVILSCGFLVASCQVVAESYPQYSVPCHVISGVVAALGAGLGTLASSAVKDPQS